jgi:hypothetical protein
MDKLEFRFPEHDLSRLVAAHEDHSLMLGLRSLYPAHSLHWTARVSEGVELCGTVADVPVLDGGVAAAREEAGVFDELDAVDLLLPVLYLEGGSAQPFVPAAWRQKYM